MTAARRTLTPTDLAPYARTLGHTLDGVTRLRGGSKKGVYRLTFRDRSTAVAYVWSPDEDLWDAGPADPRDPFSHASGLDLFTAAAHRLAAAGVRAPPPPSRRPLVHPPPGGRGARRGPPGRHPGGPAGR
ncbi:hypothetical protein ACOB87_15945 [Streptomyces sp. YS-B37]|uniref:hypothetical protein n=1 Tax=Streptomyces sp. YS-B37 TaxID=3407669 RepID=UPI003B50D39E